MREREREHPSFRGSWSSIENTQTIKIVTCDLCSDTESWVLGEHVSEAPHLWRVARDGFLKKATFKVRPDR